MRKCFLEESRASESLGNELTSRFQGPTHQASALVNLVGLWQSVFSNKFQIKMLDKTRWEPLSALGLHTAWVLELSPKQIDMRLWGRNYISCRDACWSKSTQTKIRLFIPTVDKNLHQITNCKHSSADLVPPIHTQMCWNIICVEFYYEIKKKVCSWCWAYTTGKSVRFQILTLRGTIKFCSSCRKWSESRSKDECNWLLGLLSCLFIVWTESHSTVQSVYNLCSPAFCIPRYPGKYSFWN